MKPFGVCIHTACTNNGDRFLEEVEKVLRVSKENMTNLILAGNAFNNQTVKENFVGMNICRTFSDFSSINSEQQFQM